MKRALRLAAALVLLAWPDGGRAQPVSREHIVVVRDLIGRSPLEVQRKLVGLDIDWPRQMDFELATARGVLSFATLEDNLRDPGAARFSTQSRTRTEGPPMSMTSCGNIGPLYGNGVLLMYRNGKLDRVWSPPPSGWLDASVYSAPGKLPLEDGEAFMTRWGRKPLDAQMELTIECQTLELRRGPRPRAESKQEFLSASDMQGLALMPFAVTLPFMNSSRARHQRAGAALYQQLAPGYRAPGGLKAFLRGRSGVDVIKGTSPGYVVLRINMGGGPTRNLSNFEDFAMVGVRNDLVEWRSLEYGSAAPRLPVKARQ